jgi:hypothetical protein
MSITTKRAAAGILGLTAIFVGAWAAAAPHSFFTSFPLTSHHWVAPFPPYNEHLTRDVGGLYLSLFVVSSWAVFRPRHETFVMVGVAWLVFSIPHLIFHLMHLDMFSTADAAGNVVTLGGTVVLATLLLVPASGHHRHLGGSRRTDAAVARRGRSNGLSKPAQARGAMPLIRSSTSWAPKA